jgi:hypothetical protein
MTTSSRRRRSRPPTSAAPDTRGTGQFERNDPQMMQMTQTNCLSICVNLHHLRITSRRVSTLQSLASPRGYD